MPHNQIVSIDAISRMAVVGSLVMAVGDSGIPFHPMNPAQAPPVRAAAHTRQRCPRLNVVALYDSVDSAARANAAVRSMVMALRGQRHVESRLWSFDMLARLDLRHASAWTAAEADVLLVAASALSPLPQHVASWLFDCLGDNEKGAPLIVAIYDNDGRKATSVPPLRRELLNLARRWKAPVLCSRELHALFAGDSRPPGFADLDAIDHEEVFANNGNPHWGINE